jgi:hypothetical protein
LRRIAEDASLLIATYDKIGRKISSGRINAADIDAANAGVGARGEAGAAVTTASVTAPKLQDSRTAGFSRFKA